VNNLVIEASKTAVDEIKKIIEKQNADDKAIRINISGFG
jgi:Fe-S cluster assembly iron-binding protein IscA